MNLMKLVPYANEYDKSQGIFINGHKIIEVSNTKFLSVVIFKNSVGAHKEYLKKKT